jgi:hypothetical protein
MEKYYSEGTKMTPEIVLDAVNHIYKISGNSRPENPMQFYKPVFEWLSSHLTNSDTKLTLEMKMDYFNTSTSKIFLDLFEMFEGHDATENVHVVWYYQSDDEEMQEAGEELLDLVSISYEIKLID